MPNKMLIDASHPEETRVVVTRGNRVEEFDFESADKKQLRGNIYLAKVTRVEPSLQAAFVDYGGNRHGFLAFSEIHPDYYQIPVSDRQELLEEDAHAHREEEENHRPRRSRRHQRAEKRRGDDERLTDKAPAEIEETAEALTEGAETAESGEGHAEGFEAAVVIEIEAASAESEALHAPAAASDEAPAISISAEAEEPAPHVLAADPAGFAIVDDSAPIAERTVEDEAEARGRGLPAPAESEEDDEEEDEEHVEQLGGDAMEEMPVRVHRSRRQYKIQEVIKRRQVLLVQVVKEERGNKGAALTTYLSLAGRYSVLMPNTARGGGISRKITDSGDRQRLKTIAQDLEVPEGMGVILRTAGASRTKAEVKRDFEYLLRMWEQVREMTLKSSAPTLVYEEGSLIKRSIRDLYNKDIDEVTVAGENGYREAKEFMRLLMPSHAKNVHLYRDPQPVFAKSGVEAQLDAMFTNHVTLKSGGYLVINQTEALVAIDVNSGRSTREHDIEDTALRTNLEAADEIARQLRLRDLAGLIVVDFIDMEESRNNRSVERRMKEALKNDRARIQIGRISHFGLLEMSRQRIRTGVLEGSTVICAHCAGVGTVRSTSSIALHVLRLLEDALIKSASHNITVRTRTEVALYILNQKRANLRDLERRFGVAITIAADDTLTGMAYHAMERGEPAVGVPELPSALPVPALEAPEIEAEAEIEEPEGEEDTADQTEAQDGAPGNDEEGGARRKRRRRRRRGGRNGDREASGIQANAPQPSDDALGYVAGFGGAVQAEPVEGESEGEDVEGETAEHDVLPPREDRPRRRRPRRKGRGGGERPEANADHSENAASAAEVFEAEEKADIFSEEPREPASRAEEAPEPVAHHPEPIAPTAPSFAHAEPSTVPVSVHAAQPLEPKSEPESEPESTDPDRPKRTGWWRRAKASLGN
ncbi:ribonuclease [Methylovirgula ligni]|uniref:Ribonuclease E n=1 Tax=Methylovirgula ligni TaxID=569860 RepID=A0A3D9YUP3_9HYPH|nr:ribonuclease E/G [Methylovirgula ligni]QAY96096.1 ribonuclease [Methylovirgula ligni]REF86225.1 RNAse E [Methylovirgula ligni]